MAKGSSSRPISDQIELHFALGKACDDIGQSGEAFGHWLAGNTLKRQQIDYDEATTLEELDQVRAVYTSEFIQASQGTGHPSSVPIFIMGMPRSGSTLIEQILASHPRVFGAGELHDLAAAVESTTMGSGGSAGRREKMQDIGARYIAAIERLAPGADRITDKLPQNFIFAGLIHLALPNAAIIHTIRDPIDTCLSCFSTMFTAEQNFTYDLAELGRYYRHYQSLMVHWHRVLPPSRILDVRYEDVVADLEGQARRIVAHCGLDWDPQCLAFHKTERIVRTASATQVRQPIYKDAVGRWRQYAEFLAPLMVELESTKSG
jgi:Sulfotransferase family